jgi:spore maturation protein CgeB
VNQRQYEAWAHGCLLFQWYYPGLEKLGFFHKKNCLIFDSTQKLTENIEWMLSHPQKAAEIAANGRATFLRQTPTWQYRAQEMALIMVQPRTEIRKSLQKHAEEERKMLDLHDQKSHSTPMNQSLSQEDLTTLMNYAREGEYGR